MLRFPFISFIILFLLSALLTYFIRLISLKKDIIDHPNNRSLHYIPMPRGGGLAFVILFYAALFYLTYHHIIQRNVLLSLLGGIPIACVGYCDDVFHVTPKWRALIHVASAAWGLAWLHGISFLNFGIVNYPVSILFFIVAIFITVWFVNLYNFMDGADGLAATEAVFVSAIAGGFLFFTGFYDTAYICFALTFSVLGFLVWNWPPAKIFMGDVGSGFLGYIFAMLMWVTNNTHQIPFPFWWILLAVFIADASYTLIHRMLHKKNLSQAHREHAYQRLIQTGFTHKQITLSLLCINMMICLPMIIFYFDFSVQCIFLFLVIIVLTYWLAWFLILRKYTAS